MGSPRDPGRPRDRHRVLAPLTAFSATQETDARFPVILRIGVLPLFLFSGTFFPVSQLPDVLQRLSWLSPLWHGVELCRGATTGSIDFCPAVAHVRSSSRSYRRRLVLGDTLVHEEADAMSALFVHVIERDMLAYRRRWMIFLTGFAEPLLYLLSIGVGVGALVGTVHVGGETCRLRQVRRSRTAGGGGDERLGVRHDVQLLLQVQVREGFDAMLATPMRATDVALGELSWALLAARSTPPRSS